MNPIANKKVAIVGAGPGGLILARLLQMAGTHVRVYERDLNPSARVQGATLNINEESGLKAIRRAGLMDAFQAAYRPGAEKLMLTDKDANILWTDGGGTDWSEQRPEIDRGPLRHLLLQSLRPDTVAWNRRFASLVPDDTDLTLVFQDGTRETADVVVAADGARSRLRSYVTSVRPVYAGVTVVEGTVDDAPTVLPRLHRMLDEGKICVLGDEKTIFIVAKGDGSIAYYTGHKRDENWGQTSGIDFDDPAQVRSWLGQEFSGWHPRWGELFAQTAAFALRPQYCAPLDQTWDARPNLTLLGDAAHVMPPFAGEGVNMAMQDALELAECLLSDAFPDARSAIAAYETQMRARAADAAGMTLRFTKIFHSPDAADRPVKFFQTPHEAVDFQ